MPFRLATTSYIIPDRIVPNVKFLSPFFDEIELVLFESQGEDNFPDKGEVESLREISLREGINYNIHLPIDLSLGDEEKEVRERAIYIISRIIDQTLPLKPTFYTLHLDLKNKEGRNHEDIKAWKARLIESLKRITEAEIRGSQISIETLDYPFEWIEDILNNFGFSVCLDVGHIILNKHNLREYLDRYLSKTTIFHLHGCENRVDHLSIDRLSEKQLTLILSYLKDYSGIVSLEVFSIKDLIRSLSVLEEKWLKS